ncbi:hypothetical protein R3P38DRAFT_3226871 [Favolaschia claudopus]|uniref:F-box domain-containing protein n=1 Tax=Favolaschia claudopus TaxID=2862362 RepID=A0AAV9ZTQ9_9AGAR
MNANTRTMNGQSFELVQKIVLLDLDRNAIQLLLPTCSKLQLFHVAMQNKFLFQVVSEYVSLDTTLEDVNNDVDVATYSSSPSPSMVGLPRELQRCIADHLDMRSLRFMAEASELFGAEFESLVDFIIRDAFDAVGLCWESMQFLLSCVCGLITGDFLYHLVLCTRASGLKSGSMTMVVLVELEEMVTLAAKFISASSDYVLEPTDECDDGYVTMRSTTGKSFKIIIRSSLCPQAWVMKQPYTNLINWLSGAELFVGYHRLTFNRQAISGDNIEDLKEGWDAKAGVALMKCDSDRGDFTCPALARSSRDDNSLSFALVPGWAPHPITDELVVHWRLGPCGHVEGVDRYIQVTE